ncbi:lipoprotein LpqV [Mycolicibacterium frederiksbergense]|uniref:lipoprotein LpqV n=1 Tax=Mycolicibacterium frederiksbergense TaxID=117567 RepID=UPI00265C7A3A|nr:lipoprotein LpqV [Mycolicibacterium frederiksbergense]MBX9919159.1 lipoprotein LpqV [Mycolicibacterium frederiksbergense]MDO0975225.1 lipoprotein LpqV [Mycolicibacterium frederiksbergense]
MRRYPILVTAAAAALLSGCSPSTEEPAGDTSAPSITTSQASPSPEAQVPDGVVQVSPGGVTTGVGAPADATESGYGQACLAARAWFDAQNGTVEAYLQTVQAPGAPGPGSFNMAWSELTPGQQAAVIMAANAAANAECG